MAKLEIRRASIKQNVPPLYNKRTSRGCTPDCDHLIRMSRNVSKRWNVFRSSSLSRHSCTPCRTVRGMSHGYSEVQIQLLTDALLPHPSSIRILFSTTCSQTPSHSMAEYTQRHTKQQSYTSKSHNMSRLSIRWSILVRNNLNWGLLMIMKAIILSSGI
jgi:hypothetical protein